MIEMKNDLIESCSSNLVFLRENNFQEDQVDIWPWKLTWTFENAHMSAHYYFYSKAINISFKYVDFYAKMLLLYGLNSQKLAMNLF